METLISKHHFLKQYFDYAGWDYQKEVTLIENGRLDQNHPLRIIRTEGKLVIEYMPGFSNFDATLLSSNISNQEIVASILGTNVSFLEKQSFIMFAPKAITLPPIEGFSIEPLTLHQKIDLGRLKSACSNQELESSLVGLEDDDTLGIYHNRDLLAAGSLWFLGDKLADIHLITHPKFRSIGFGKLLIGLLINRSFRFNRIPIARGELQNEATYKVAITTGFIEAISIFEIEVD